MKFPIKSGVVIIARWRPFSLWKHRGIISIENGTPYVYDNDPDNPKNNKGGNIARVTLKHWLKNRDVIEFYDSDTTTKEIKKRVEKYWGKNFNWVVFNCRHFIKKITNK